MSVYMIQMREDRVTNVAVVAGITPEILNHLVADAERRGYFRVDAHTYHVASNAWRCGLPFGETHPEQRTGRWGEEGASG